MYIDTAGLDSSIHRFLMNTIIEKVLVKLTEADAWKLAVKFILTSITFKIKLRRASLFEGRMHQDE